MMMLIQVAQEAAKSTSSLTMDGVAIMALIGASGLALREYFKSRRQPKNGNGKSLSLKPGTAQECQAHRGKLIELETKQEGTKELLTEVRGDVKKLLRLLPPGE